MRVASLSLDFGVILIALVVLLHTQGTYANRENHINRERNQLEDNCPSNNCLPAEECEIRATSGSCRNSENVCCSLVKREHRTLCRHFGGECMKDCIPRLTQRASDCSDNQKCCVLV